MILETERSTSGQIVDHSWRLEKSHRPWDLEYHETGKLSDHKNPLCLQIEYRGRIGSGDGVVHRESFDQLGERKDLG